METSAPGSLFPRAEKVYSPNTQNTQWSSQQSKVLRRGHFPALQMSVALVEWVMVWGAARNWNKHYGMEQWRHRHDGFETTFIHLQEAISNGKQTCLMESLPPNIRQAVSMTVRFSIRCNPHEAPTSNIRIVAGMKCRFRVFCAVSPWVCHPGMSHGALDRGSCWPWQGEQVVNMPVSLSGRCVMPW